jgi:hypothetical protein
MQVVHPTNNPALVSYHRPELINLLPSLELALDCWNLLDTVYRGSAKAKYLPREQAEPKSAYQARLDRSTYTPIYRDSIKAYAGLLGRFQLADAPPSMNTWEWDIDLQGSNIQSFWGRCDELAIRDGGVFVMVDMMPVSTDNGNNFLDQQRDGRHPYLVMVERKDVVNWTVEYKGGREYIHHATIRQIKQVPDDSGFGVKLEPVYYVLKPNLVEEYRLEKKGTKWYQILVQQYATTLPVVPLVWYGASTSKFAQGEIPLNGLAELSIQHYQSRSDLTELLHKCAMPVPVRKGAPTGADGRPAPLVIGPNTAVDLPGEGGEFTFAEPTGRSLERHQAEVTHIEQLMDRSGLNFLYGANIKTATEASLRASQIASQVSALVRNKTSAFGTVMRLWAAYAGELGSIKPESGIVINDSLINRPIDPSGIAQLVNLRNAKILSTETVLSELQRGGVLDPDLKIVDEISRIDKETAALEAAAPATDTKPVAGMPNQSGKVTVQPTVNPLGKQ